MEVKLEIWGGTVEHGRACYFFEMGTYAFMFDCGINKTTGEMPMINEKKLKTLNYVFLSHSHEDHSEGIIRMMEQGLKIKTIMSKETARQLRVLYSDRFAGELENFIYLEALGNPCEWINLENDVQFCYGYSGHVLGSVWYAVKAFDKTVFYSGDYNDEGIWMPFDSPKGIELVEGFDIGIIDAAHGVKKETYQERLIRINEEIDKILEGKGSILFPGNPYGKFVEYVGLLRRDYRDKVFAFHTSVYGEVLHFIEDRELLEMLISNKENNKVFDQFSELEEDEIDIWITPVVGCHLKGYQNFIDDFMRREENRVILLTKQRYHKTEDNFDWIKKNQAKVSKYSLKPHQDIEGVERLLNEKNFKQVILCHAKESTVRNVAESLNKKGYDYVKIAHIKDTINF